MSALRKDQFDTWFAKSSFCAGGECVEVARLQDGKVVVRDAKDITQQPLVFTSVEWQAFVRGVKAGEFDVVPRAKEDNLRP